MLEDGKGGGARSAATSSEKAWVRRETYVTLGQPVRPYPRTRAFPLVCVRRKYPTPSWHEA
jgi:hypothetical protein